MSDEDESKIAAVICQLAKINTLRPDEDIYTAGISSIQAFQLLVELEAQFSVTLPDEAFVAARTVRTLERLIVSQRATEA